MRARFALPVAVVAAVCVIPSSLFVLRAWGDGDALVVDQRDGAVVPGPVEGAVPGGRVVVTVPPDGVALPPRTREARVQLRLSSFSRSRILVVTGPRGLFDVRPVWPEDGTCFDLGPVPEAGHTVVYHVRALSPAGAWGLTPARATSADLLDVRSGEQPLDYRVVAHVPVGPIEALARLTFFLRISRVALLSLVVALGSLVFSVRWWLDGRPTSAAGALMTGMAMLFVSCTPPFQAADESTHMGTLEYVVASAGSGRARYWPASISMATLAVGLDDVRHHPENALPLRSAAERRAAARVLAEPATGEASQPTSVSASEPQTSDEAPLFYPLAIAIPSAILDLRLADRVFLYRVLVVAPGIGLCVAGVAAIALAGLPGEALAGCLAVFLIPQWLGIVSSTTPYTPGLGAAMFATALLMGSMALRRWTAFVWLLAATTVAVAGGLMVREVYLLALLFGAVAILRAARPRQPVGEPKRASWLWALLAVGILAGLAGLAASLAFLEYGLPANLRAVEVLFERKRLLSQTLPRWLPVIFAPLLAAAGLVVAGRWTSGAMRRNARRWLAAAVPLGILLLLVASRWVFPDARVPTSARVAGMTAELFVRRVVKALAVTALSWDQDFIVWKSFFSALGWQDLLLPPVVYAVARWLFLAMFLAIPLAYLRCLERTRRVASELLALLAAGTSVLLLMTVVRGAASMLHGRYLLFVAPLLGIALSRIGFLRADRTPLRLLVGALLVLDVFVALYLIPCRYLLQGAGVVWAPLP